MANRLTSRVSRRWMVIVSLICMQLAIHDTLQAQFFTRVTDIGPLATDAFLSTGASWNDINNDGWPDLLALGESSNHFYLNNGDGTFSALLKEPFLTPLGVGNIGIWADYDNDGDQDLFLGNFVTEAGGTQVAPNVLYRNAGPPDFDLDVIDLGDDLNASPSASWIDYDQDGDVDLFSAGAARSRNGNPTRDLFYRQDGPTVFSLLQNLPFMKARRGFGTHDTWVDYDNDGDEDLFVVNWTVPNELYKSLLMETGNPNRFAQVTTSGLTDEGSAFDIGSSWGDYDNDGDFDVFIPIANGTNRLYQNNGDGTFSRITAGPGVKRRSVMGVWGDYDNDGDLDLYVGAALPSLYRNEGDGTFVVTGAEMGDILSSPPALQAGNWGDYDNDGDLDLYLLTYAIPAQRTGTPQPNYLIRNNLGNTNHWLKVKCVGTVSNRSGIGAKIRVKSTIGGTPVWQLRYVSGGASSFVFHGGLIAHFGIGDATTVDSLLITWPSGIVQVVENVVGDQVLTVTEEVPRGFMRPNFYADQTSGSGETALTVQFMDVSLQDPSTPIVSWAWDFDNDGSTDATVPNPTWTYTAQKDTAFSVMLTVSNGITTSRLLREAYITFDGIVTGIDEERAAVPTAFSLEANYPNPFNASTTIRYVVPMASEITLVVYDVTGSKVAVLAEGLKTVGVHEVTFNAINLPTGFYLYRLETPVGRLTRGMLLIN